MDGRTILPRAVTATLAGALALAAVPACADVMEVNGESSAWIALAKASAPSAEPQTPTQPAGEVPQDVHTPDEAIADPERHRAKLPEPFREDVIMLARRFDISPALIEALVWQESRWRTNAVSPVGARGLAQLMPGTARDLGVDANDPRQNLEGGARYLREQLDRFGGDIEKALAAYNAGPGRVQRAGGIPRIRETQNYVAAIMGRLSNHSRSSYQ